jgi:predicted nucleic acid-binding protein
LGRAALKFFFDTSVLLPCFYASHVHHAASLRTFLEAGTGNGSCAAHSLAEFYSSATGFPGKNRMSSHQALLILDEIRERLDIVALTSEEYYSAIRDASVIGVAGGTIYDALLCRCAEKAAAERIYTWNVGHFKQFSQEIAQRVQTP